MVAKIHSSARALLVMSGVVVAAACGAGTPASVPSSGELLIEWQPQPEQQGLLPEVQVEIRGVGDVAVRRRVELRAPDELHTRLSLPAGIYDVRLSSAVLQASPDEMQGQPLGAPALQLPPPQIVLVSEAGTTRARVALAPVDGLALASLQEAP